MGPGSAKASRTIFIFPEHPGHSKFSPGSHENITLHSNSPSHQSKKQNRKGVTQLDIKVTEGNTEEGYVDKVIVTQKPYTFLPSGP